MRTVLKGLEKSCSTRSIWWGFFRVLVRSLIVVSSEVSQERLDLKPCFMRMFEVNRKFKIRSGH